MTARRVLEGTISRKPWSAHNEGGLRGYRWISVPGSGGKVHVSDGAEGKKGVASRQGRSARGCRGKMNIRRNDFGAGDCTMRERGKKCLFFFPRQEYNR